MKQTKLFVAVIMMFALAWSALAQTKATPVPKKDKATTVAPDQQSAVKVSEKSPAKSPSGVKDTPVAKKYTSKKLRHGKHDVDASKKKETATPPRQK